MSPALLLVAAGDPSWLPQFLRGWVLLGMELWKWVAIAVIAVVGYLLAAILEKGLLWLGRRLASFTALVWDDHLVEAWRGPLKLLLYGPLLYSAIRLAALPATATRAIELISRSVVIVALAWFVLRFLRESSTAVQKDLARKGNVVVDRGIVTQLSVLRSIIEVAVYVIAAALLLMQFDAVRSVGVSLLASAGIAGIVFGFAAQKTLGSLLGGIQLSMTQPIRLGDSVVVEGEFGTVEEIRLTYVVVRIWDLRRLVVPVSYFLDRPFQNWTRAASNELMGPVLLHVDYSTDIEALRAELGRILEDEGRTLWDGKVKGVVVLDTFERTMTVRALVSAADAGALFDLRCLVREKLVAFLSKNPLWLPQTRNRVQEIPPQPTKAA